jgi:L-ascorbate oxidase
MAGALIVRGNRLPTEKSSGDIDTLLKRRDGTDMRERILVLQQIQYACLDDNGNVRKDSQGNVVWDCPANDKNPHYGVESYDQFGPGSWAASGRYTSINGTILPTFVTRAGDVERWRIVHAGVRDTISLEFRKLKQEVTVARINSLMKAALTASSGMNCTGNPIPYHVIADDGLTRATVWQTTLATLHNPAIATTCSWCSRKPDATALPTPRARLRPASPRRRRAGNCWEWF